MRPEGTAGVVPRDDRAQPHRAGGSAGEGLLHRGEFSVRAASEGAGCAAHHQFGAEAFGIADPAQDVECILLQMDFYRRTGLKDVQLQINSLGDAESKQRYRDLLVAFLSPKAGAAERGFAAAADGESAADPGLE